MEGILCGPSIISTVYLIVFVWGLAMHMRTFMIISQGYNYIFISMLE